MIFMDGIHYYQTYAGYSPRFKYDHVSLPAFHKCSCYDNEFSDAIMLHFYYVSREAPLSGACFEQGQNKRSSRPLIAVHGDYSRLLEVHTTIILRCVPLRGVLGHILDRTGNASQWNGGITEKNILSFWESVPILS